MIGSDYVREMAAYCAWQNGALIQLCDAFGEAR